MANAVERHLRQLALHQAESSVKERRRALARMVRIMGCPLLEASADDLMAWREGLHLSPGSIATYVGHAREFYAWAVAEELIPKSPAAGLPVPRVPRRLPRPIAEEDLMAAVLAAPQPIRLMLVLAAWCGLRAQEIARLRRASIRERLPLPVLLVTAEMAKGGWLERAVPLSGFVIRECESYGLPRAGLVFRRADGRPGPVQPWTVSKVVNGFLHDLGIAETIHCCRHRFATQLYQATHDLRLVQELLGHQSTKATAVYVAISEPSAAAAVDALPVPCLRAVG